MDALRVNKDQNTALTHVTNCQDRFNAFKEKFS